jgi:NAD(P)-dependent dehydrogenase (short-subunit alcohol dehydrogenase family)
MTDILDSKVAIVTGAGKGIGLAIARKLSDAGAHVVVADIDEGAAQEAAGTLRSGEGVALDVRDENQVSEVVRGVVDRHGHLDVMVSNAGIATANTLVAMTLEEWRSVMDVNLDGVFLCTKHAALAMAGNGGGSIINIGSIKAAGGSPGAGHYGAAKAGVVSLSKTAAMELRDAGVRVNAICPGWVGTDMVADRKEEFESLLGISFDEMIDHIQGGRLGEPEEIAAVALFLASDRSRFSSGTAYVVDGGATASLV